MAKNPLVINAETRVDDRRRMSSRRLANDLFAALSDDFALHGSAVIVELRETNLKAYIDLITKVLPQESSSQSLHLSAHDAPGLEATRRFLAEFEASRSEGDHAGAGAPLHVLPLDPDLQEG